MSSTGQNWMTLGTSSKTQDMLTVSTELGLRQLLAAVAQSVEKLKEIMQDDVTRSVHLPSEVLIGTEGGTMIATISLTHSSPTTSSISLVAEVKVEKEDDD